MAAKFGLSGALTFVKGDFDRHEFPPEAFDAIICIESLAHCHDKEATIRHLAKSLKTGGCLVIVDDVRFDSDQRENSPELAHFNNTFPLISPSA